MPALPRVRCCFYYLNPNRLTMKKHVLSTLLFCLSVCLYAQPGGVDPGFQPATSDFIRIYKVAAQPDGKVVAFGSTYSSMGEGVRLTRYNGDGSPDSAFRTSGYPGRGAYSPALGLQQNGDILFTSIYSNLAVLRRVYADGSADASFRFPANE